MRTIFLTFALFFLSIPLLAQNNLKTSAGVGIIDAFNAGVDYRIKQSELGINFGFWPKEMNGLISSINYYYHFAGKSEYTTIRPWFVRSGIFVARYKYFYAIEYHFLPTLRLGREFNFTQKLGLAIDIGADYQLFMLSRKLSTETFDGATIIPYFPNGSIKIFYRF